MTKKDYIKFAELLHFETQIVDNDTNPQKMLEYLITTIADIFETDNQRFNRERFYKSIY